jgi:hypothetical protein
MRRRVVRSTKMDAQQRFQKIGAFILDHTGVSYLLWVLLNFFVYTPLVVTAPLSEPTRYGWLTWVTLGDFIYTPLAAALVDRKAPDRRQMLAMQWALAQGPVVFSVAALYDRSPQWLGAIATAEALVLMVWSVRRAKSSSANEERHVETAT